MNEKAKTILVGSFIIIACLAILGVLLFLRPSVGDGKKKLFVCFTSIEKLEIGTRVTFAGKPVGQVIAIREIYDARSQPSGRTGHICFYELELAIDSHTVVYDTDEITVHTTGLMGERTIAIIPKPVPKGTPSYPVTDQVMYGKSGDAVEETLNQIISLSNKASNAIDLVQKILTENREPVSQAVRNIRDAAAQVTETFHSANETHMIDHVSSAFESIATITDEWQEGGLGFTIPQIADNLSSITTSLDKPDLISDTMENIHSFSTTLSNKKGDVESIIDNIRHMSERMSGFSDSLNKEGSFAKFFSDETAYLQIVQLLSKANVLMDDVNNYGVLFHLDKAWQRERAKRLNLLTNFSKPGEFTCYFEEEMGQITLSLCRIAKALDKARAARACCGVIKDKDFNCHYSEVLSRIQDVEETLELYRQQLIECGQGERLRRPNCCQ